MAWDDGIRQLWLSGLVYLQGKESWQQQEAILLPEHLLPRARSLQGCEALRRNWTNRVRTAGDRYLHYRPERPDLCLPRVWECSSPHPGRGREPRLGPTSYLIRGWSGESSEGAAVRCLFSGELVYRLDAPVSLPDAGRRVRFDRATGVRRLCVPGDMYLLLDVQSEPV